MNSIVTQKIRFQINIFIELEINIIKYEDNVFGTFHQNNISLFKNIIIKKNKLIYHVN